MGQFDDDLGKPVHCRELNSGKYYTGTLLITDTEMSVELVAYGQRYLEVEGTQPVHLQTKNNNVVSLHYGYGATGTSSKETDDHRQRTLAFKRIRSSIAVLGRNPWHGTDIVRSCHFELPDIEYVLNHIDKTDRIHASEMGSGSDTNLFIVKCANLTVRVDYYIEGAVSHPFPTKSYPTFAINFDDEVTLYSYLNQLNAVMQLFSISVGMPLIPEKTRISRQTIDAMYAETPDDKFIEPHLVKYIWPESKLEKMFMWGGASFLLALDDIELEAMKACLAAWMNRHSEWHKANALMTKALSLNSEMSTHRLLNSCRWFEEIPYNNVRQVIPDNDVKVIAEAAAVKALELGYKDTVNRIAGSLKRISEETLRARLVRLLRDIRTKCGEQIIDDSMITDLQFANGLRGKVAHGHFGLDADDVYASFARSVYAMEAFCFLLTVKDLPMSDAGRKRLARNPMLQQYLDARAR